MSQLPHLAARILNVPLMIDPPKFRAMLAAIGHRLGLPSAAMPEVLRSIDQRCAIVTGPRMDAEYRRSQGGWGYKVDQGIAVVDVSGALTNRMNFDLDASTELRSYETIRADLGAAAKAPDVKGILLRMDTPGGEVAGAFDMANFIAAVNKEKPVWAVTDDAAFSAGYLLASQAKKVFVSQTGGLGSIGVIMTHVDYSEMLEATGIQVTTIFKGDRKNDFSPYEPLSEGAQAVAEELVAKDYRMFVEAVARGRKGMTAESVAATEAGLFFGDDAVSAKLADGIVNFHDALRDMQKKIGAGQQQFGFASAPDVERAAASEDPAPGEDSSDEKDPAIGDPPSDEPEQELEPEASGDEHEEGTIMDPKRPEAASPPPDLDAIRSEAKQAGYEDAAEVVELCALAGKVELAAGFIRAKKSAKDVRAALLTGQAEEHEKSPQVSNKTTATSGLRDHPRQVDSMRAHLKARGITPADERGAN